MMNESENNDDVLFFQVDAGLLFQLGEQLVARRSVALAELVKNSFDADATKVTIFLENVKKPKGTILIEDNGVGMTFEQIQNSWMRIATNEKIRNPRSDLFERPRTGAKGVGRFAARRLAHKLILHSVALNKNGQKEKVVVTFDWDKFFQSGQNLVDIRVPFERNNVSDNTPTGVLLYLENVQDVWVEQDVIDLQKDLFSLVTPFPEDTLKLPKSNKNTKEDPGFSVTIEIPEFPTLSGEMGDRFLSTAWGVLTGVLDDNGYPEYSLELRIRKNKEIYKPDESIFPDIAKARFRVHFFVYKSENYQDFVLDTREASRLGREGGGIKIYQDGFRVFPYGDLGDDWLGIDSLRARRTAHPDIPKELETLENQILGRPFLLLPGNNQLFGVVSISRLLQPKIEINVSRERLVENEAFNQLRRFVQLGIYWLTLQYAKAKYLDESENKEKEKQLLPMPSAKEVIRDAQRQIASSQELSKNTKSAIISVLSFAQERLDVEQGEYISELSMLRVLATTGVMISVINHQLRTVIDGLRSIHTDLSDIRTLVSSAILPTYDEILENIQDWYEGVEKQVSQLGFLLGRGARERRRSLPLHQVVEEVTTPSSLYMREHGITLINEIPSYTRTPSIYEAELHALLLQIFSNSLKAVRNAPNRQICFRVVDKPDALGILILDTGVGLAPELREKVFKPFETNSTPDPILGIGTGLGLWIVSEIVKSYSGKAQFVDVTEPWETGIEITLPLE